MDRAGVSRSALARATGVDRSTIGQLLARGETRLPNVQLAADAAAHLDISADWLLGLTDRPETPGDLIAAAMSLGDATRFSADEKILEWHREAAGYKIRHVPATLPDMLKTEAMLLWEYEAHLGKTSEQAIQAMRDNTDWLNVGTSDYEIAVPLHEMAAMAEGSGYYRGLGKSVREAQLAHMRALCEAHYPALRVFLFDARRVFSAPVTVFGPILAAIYVGRIYLAFRERARVKTLSDHFDWLVREAVVDARDVALHIERLPRG